MQCHTLSSSVGMEDSIIVNLCSAIPIYCNNQLLLFQQIYKGGKNVIVKSGNGLDNRMGKAGLYLLYSKTNIPEVIFVPLKRPPAGEAYLQIANLQEKEYVTSRALYGDVLHSGLAPGTISSPLLLFAPMDLPIEMKTNVTTDPCRGWCTKPDTWNILCSTNNPDSRLCVVELFM
ncbi:hypothetical protein ACFFGV_01190 [Pontibacillus salicampi]|uniref:Uncharacterized protein n=1 Tax=Pontibacillus salicampi TaxID=1449801 RepID=A0ABV6LIH9_9BACI